MADHLSTRELDRLAGLTEGHTHAIESGARPNIELRTAGALADVLGITTDWLRNGSGRDPAPRTVRASVESMRAKQSAA